MLSRTLAVSMDAASPDEGSSAAGHFLRDLLQRPMTARLAVGWLIATLFLAAAAATFSNWYTASVSTTLTSERERITARLNGLIDRRVGLVALHARDPELTALIGERRSDCQGECLAANSFELTERLAVLRRHFPGATALFVRADGRSIGAGDSELTAQTLTAFESNPASAGWVRPLPRPTTLGATGSGREASSWFFGEIAPDAWLVLEVDAYTISDDVIESTIDGLDAYLFDARAVLLSRPSHTDVLTRAGVLDEPYPILNVSLREPAVDLGADRSSDDRTKLPLIAAVSAALKGGGDGTFPYRSYTGERVIGTSAFFEELGVGLAVELPASRVAWPVRAVWAAAVIASLLVASWMVLLQSAVARRDAKRLEALSARDADWSKLDSMLDAARDEVEEEVSRRNRALGDLSRAEATRGALMDAFADGVLVFDDEGHMVDCNPAFRQQWEVGADASTEQVFNAMADQLADQLDDLEGALQGDEVPAFLSLKNGRQMTVESWKAAFGDGPGGRLLVFRESRRGEAAEPSAQLAGIESWIASSIDLPVAAVADDGSILFFTQALTTLCGSMSAGDNIHDILHAESDCPGAADCRLLDPRFEAEPWGDGKIYREELDGVTFIGVAANVELFEESKHRRRPGMARPLHLGWHLQKLWCLQLISRSTNHDFNNRVSAILGYADFIEITAGDDAESVPESVGEIRTAAEAGQEMVQGYMGFARVLVGDLSEVQAGHLVDASSRLGLLVKPYHVDVETSVSHGDAKLLIHENLMTQVIVVHLLEAISDLEPVGGKLAIELVDEGGLAVKLLVTASEPIVRPRWRQLESAFNRTTTRSILDHEGGSQTITETGDGYEVLVRLPGHLDAGEVVLLVGESAWADALGERLERRGKAVLAVDGPETALAVLQNQPHMFGGIVLHGDIGADGAMLQQVASDAGNGARFVLQTPDLSDEDVLAHLL